MVSVVNAAAAAAAAAPLLDNNNSSSSGKRYASYQSINTTPSNDDDGHNAIEDQRQHHNHNANGTGAVGGGGSDRGSKTPGAAARISPSSYGTGVFAPMANLSRRDRMYRRLVGGLLVLVLMVSTGLAYFVLRRTATEDNYDATGGDNGYNDVEASSWRGSGGVVVVAPDDDRHHVVANSDDPAAVNHDHDEDDVATRNELMRARRQAAVAAAARQRLNRHPHRQAKTFRQSTGGGGCQTTLLLVRHCEKSGPDAVDANGNRHCNHVGFKRAEYLATLFGNIDDDENENSNANTTETVVTRTTTPPRWPTPSYLYALTEIRKHQHRNYREWETLRPLAESIAMTMGIVGVDETTTMTAVADNYIHLIPSDPSVFARGTYLPLLQSGDLCGNKITVVAWEYATMSALANAVGCGPDQGCPTEMAADEYDHVWQIDLVFPPAAVAAPVDALFNETTMTLSSSRRKPHKPRWHVYGTVVAQGFDPSAKISIVATTSGDNDNR